MLTTSVIQYGLFLAVVTLLVKPAGLYLAAVFEGRPTLLDPFLRPIERFLYFLTRVCPGDEMGWKRYTIAFICFSLVGTLGVYAVLRLQNQLPGGPANSYLSTPITPDLAFNTAISFSTTTTWQAYGGESTMKYWTQILAFVGQNFLAGAAGLAIGIAFIRGFARRDTFALGNFWVDLVRATLWILLPISILGSLILIWQGVPMNFRPYAQLKTTNGDTRIVTQGPVAALEFIEQLGTNGGGFFNANGAHPFENPTPLANFIEMLGIAVLPAALTYTFGKMTGRKRAGWALYGIMVFLFILGLALFDVCERHTPPRLAEIHLTGGNMEGKEVRFGIGSSTLAAIVTSNGATGSVNAAPDSLTPFASAIPLSNMLLGEITFGGLGTGLYSMIMIALVGLFMAGLIVGRTPEYIGKRIGPSEMKLVMLFNLATPIAVLALAAWAVVSHAGLAALTTNTGPHGFTEILFAYASCVANNGQAMAGLSTGSIFYNLTAAAAMLVGRFGLAIPALALAGMLAEQGRRVPTTGSLPSDSFLFGVVVLGSALLVGGLNFFPALALGPVIEHFASSGSRILFQ
jgi:potassium-transporting ATPase potassium-binding subunit